MHRHPSRILMVTAAVLLIATGTRAQKQDVQEMMQVIGDGAAQCAAAKIAAASRAPRNSSSVASANFDATFYHLDLFLDMDDDVVSGTVRIEGRVVNSALSTLTLDLAPSMGVGAVSLPDGTPLTYGHPGSALNITLPSAQAPGSIVAVDVTYSGIPRVDGFGNFVFGTRNINNTSYRYAWSLSEPYGAREWWPCKDHPADKADSVRVTVEVPSQYRVGSQGLLVSEVPNGPTTVYDWVSHYPISSYLVSVAVGVYVRHLDTYDRPPALAADYGALSMPFDNLRYDDGSSDLPAGWAAATDMLEVEEDWFGPYPFANEKYGHAEFTFGGGMEHQTMTSAGSSAVSIVAHELAHQWFGDSITPKRWPHLWLSEGFATYAELLYFLDRRGAYPGFYEAVFSQRYESALRAAGTLVLVDTTSVNEMFDGDRVYAKGGIVLYMLHHLVGDAVFKDIMRSYADDPAVKYGNAVTADFQRVAETVSGLDLATFFSQWVTSGTGYPIYSAKSSWQPIIGGYHVAVTLEQKQTMPTSNVSVFETPIEFSVIAESPQDSIMAVLVQVLNDRRSQDFEFDVTLPDSFAVSQVIVDPHRRVLRKLVAPAKAPPYPVIAWTAPNPTRGGFRLQYSVDRESAVDIQVFDVGGRRVLTQKIAATPGIQQADIDTSALSSGVYFLRLSTSTGVAKTKFVLVR